MLLLVVCLLAGLVLVNAALSLFDVWKLDTGAPVPTPWSGLFDAGRASQRSDTLALLGTALLGGAGLYFAEIGPFAPDPKPRPPVTAAISVTSPLPSAGARSRRFCVGSRQ